ncbi:thiamine pyrophosphokinase [Paenibacillus darwinianus]|uniref:Thiamine diphosphokinase n=1 Tax=Paenibacillus darwinianus TaxID=1380763 RepID=A0A9W5RZE3_9BACL|nr:thiamine diphosphokinase [Paenibacillus darwinianus]EXX85688.1 thiamine pyrophosphokinase [Paenibacillus darwinianus]EXX89887.1 thiamine pyrophosphokinase [Paenibacillus darwinianus]EXX90724.1 thiamine pyrophosphokinase [Paenibacillus darwinianus]
MHSPARRVLIFSGGRLGLWALAHIRPEDRLIGADSGSLFLVKHGFRPDLAIGDFDSVTAQQLERIKAGSLRTEACDPVDKDYTDTELAFRRALEEKPDEIVMIGALGTRFDHSIANIHLLVEALRCGIPAVIADEHNEIRLTDARLTIRSGSYANVSLLPLTPRVNGITLRGFRYPLTEATLDMGQSLGISNVLDGEAGEITVRNGWLLVIQSRD